MNNYTDQLLIKDFGIEKKVLELIKQAEKEVLSEYEALDDIMAYNQYKVLSALQKNRIADMHFA